ncbi:MAG TPA: CinA family protein [Micropepsaceae bacterium]|nr:CinA family protein [Micropepsaceae bacterium]
MFPETIVAATTKLVAEARARTLRIATAESCTGGLIAGALTAIPGSSDVFERGAVVYANQAKMEMLGVSAGLLERHGAVSAEVARAMAEGALAHSAADIAVSCTGIAGPGGGSAEKPVGLVYLAVARRNRKTRGLECRFGEISREEIRLRTVAAGLQLLLDATCDSP